MGSLLGGKPKNKSTVEVPAWLDTQNRSLVSRAVEASNQEYTPYTGNRVAEFTPDAQQAFQGFRDMQGKYQGNFDQALAGANQLMGRANGPTADEVSSLMNPYLQNVLNVSKRNAAEDWATRERENRRREGLIGSFGGSRVGLSQAQRQKDLAQQLADMETKGLFEGYNQAMNRYDQGTQTLASGIDSTLTGAQAAQSAGYTDLANLLKTGELQREQGQMEEDFNYEQFDRQQAYPYEQVNFLSNILNPMTNAYKGGTTSQSGGTSKLGQAVGIAASVAGLFSDERVKENIKKVGELDNGLPVYSYNYKGVPQTMIGLLAQEVEKENPKAVGEIDGIKTVDYKKATKKYADGGSVTMSPPQQSREQLAKILQAAGYSGTNFPDAPQSKSGGDMGDLGGLKDLLAKGTGGIKDLFAGGAGMQADTGDKVMDSAYNNVMNSAANPFNGIQESGNGGFMSDLGSWFGKFFADGGLVEDDFRLPIGKDPLITYGRDVPQTGEDFRLPIDKDLPTVPQRPPVSNLMPYESDDNIFTLLGKGAVNQVGKGVQAGSRAISEGINQLGDKSIPEGLYDMLSSGVNAGGRGLQAVDKALGSPVDYLYNTPAKDLFNATKDKMNVGAPIVQNENDAAMVDKIKNKFAPSVNTADVGNMNDAEFEQYREQMRNNNANAVKNPGMMLPGSNNPLPVEALGTFDVPAENAYESPKSQSGGNIFDLVKMPMPQEQAPAKEEGFKLFGREVNLPLLIGGLTMLGSEGSFGEQLQAGVKAGMDVYNNDKAQAKAQKDAQRQELKDYLEYVRTMAEIEKLKNSGGLTPYQRAVLDLRERELSRKISKDKSEEEGDEGGSVLDVFDGFSPEELRNLNPNAN